MDRTFCRFVKWIYLQELKAELFFYFATIKKKKKNLLMHFSVRNFIIKKQELDTKLSVISPKSLTKDKVPCLKIIARVPRTVSGPKVADEDLHTCKQTKK